MADLLFELGSEELPAAFVNPAVVALGEGLRRRLEEARLLEESPDSRSAWQTFGTPRRLAVAVLGLRERQADRTRRVVGPPLKVARDGEEKLTAAGLGFARKNGLDAADLRDENGYLVADLRETGQPAAHLLGPILEATLRDLSFPKAMRWGSGEVTYARPLLWICAVLDGMPLPVRFGDLASGGSTRGHRFLHPQSIVVRAPRRYAELLREAKVLADFTERRARVKQLCAEIAGRMGGQVVADEALLDQVTNLVEWPSAMLGQFDESHLSLPREVLISELKEHQRYFALESKGQLLPNFIAIAGTPVRDEALVRNGFERVLRARLADARFFFDTDLKVPLAERVSELGTVVFQKKLGTILEKVERIEALTEWLGVKLQLPPERRQQASRAAHLCKADLVTGMVGEFPELQGVMGRAYALASGEPPAVALAIEEHYLPRFSGDQAPSDAVGALVGLADRFDTLCGLFGIGKPPSATADPFALRRSCLALIRLIVGSERRLSLQQTLDKSLALLAAKLTKPIDEVRVELLDFFRARLKALWGETFPADVVEAILSSGFDDLWLAKRRLEALAEIVNHPDSQPLAVAFKRAVNILGQAPAQALEGEVQSELLQEEAERGLFKAALAARANIQSLVAAADYPAVLRELIALKPAIDLFFDKVLVMSEELPVRYNRFRLLAALRALFDQVADLTKIQGESRS